MNGIDCTYYIIAPPMTGIVPEVALANVGVSGSTLARGARGCGSAAFTRLVATVGIMLLLLWHADPTQAQQRGDPLVVMFGGAEGLRGDTGGRGDFKHYCDKVYEQPRCAKKECIRWGVGQLLPGWARRRAEEIASDWEANGRPRVVLVGYSYGADSAYQVAQRLRPEVSPKLITLDPVSRRGRRHSSRIPKPEAAGRWVNVYTKPAPERDRDDVKACDITAYLGVGWRNDTSADRNILSSGNHCDFRHMLSLVQDEIRNAAACE